MHSTPYPQSVDGPGFSGGRAGGTRSSPIREVNPLARGTERQPPARSEFTGRRILVVDDDPGMQAFCRVVLASAGFAFDVFSDGNLALEAARSTRYDLVLLDYDMPRITGPQVLQKLREQCQDPYLKILFMSGLARPDAVADLLPDGANDFLEKPFSPAQLREWVEAALRLKETQERSETTNRELELRVLERTAELARANAVLQHEIEARKAAEENAWLAHELSEQLLAAIPSILIALGSDGRITRWNQLAESLFGIPSAEVVGRQFCDTPIPWKDWDIVPQILDAAATGKPAHLKNIPFQSRAGSVGFLRLTLSPILAASGSLRGMLLLGDLSAEGLLPAAHHDQT
jgi:PAS domain S-box-containing protein